MPGPKKQYPVQIAVRISVDDAAKLDKLRGAKSRAEAIRELIRRGMKRK